MTDKKPIKPQCEHKECIRIGDSNMIRCANEDCRRVTHWDFERKGAPPSILRPTSGSIWRRTLLS